MDGLLNGSAALIVPDFEQETHTYRYFDVAPSVTDILKAIGIGHKAATDGGYEVPEDTMEYARDRGQDIHAAAQLLLENDLDWDSLEEDVLPYIVGLQNWVDKTGFVPDLIEQSFYCPEYDYAGTIDFTGWIGEEYWLIDLKTGGAGKKPWHHKQMAAYAYPLRRHGIWPFRMVLELKQTTKRGYTPHPLPPSETEWDWTVFLAARTIYADLIQGKKALG